jgi:hypothetical protein
MLAKCGFFTGSKGDLDELETNFGGICSGLYSWQSVRARTLTKLRKYTMLYLGDFHACSY